MFDLLRTIPSTQLYKEAAEKSLLKTQEVGLAEDFEVMPVMMADTPTLEEQIASLAKSLEVLSASQRARDQQMGYIVNKLENKERGKSIVEEEFHQDKTSDVLKEGSSQTQENKGKAIVSEGNSQKAIPTTAQLLHVEAIQEMINDVLKGRLEGNSSRSMAYVTPSIFRFKNHVNLKIFLEALR